MESYSSDEGPVETGPLRAMVEDRRNRKLRTVTQNDGITDHYSDDDRSPFQIESDSSDYNFTHDDFNSTDSEWDKDEEKRMTKKCPDSDSSDSDDDVPLKQLIKGGIEAKTVDRDELDKAATPSNVEGDMMDEDIEALFESAGFVFVEEACGMDEVYDDCRHVISLMINMVECEVDSERREDCGNIMTKMLNEIELKEKTLSPDVVMIDDNTRTQYENESDENSFLSDITEVEADSIVEMPTPSDRGRKRKRNEDAWVRTKKKRAINQGKEFVDGSGKVVVQKKCMKPGCGPNCRQKCHSKLSEAKREELFHTFWQLPSIVEKRLFLSHCVKKIDKKTRSVNDSRRKVTLCWTLPAEEEEFNVCKTFFLHTLAISEQMVKTAMTKMEADGFNQTDRRGCAFSSTRDEERAAVRVHIETFPVVESHYCRQNTKRKYLGAHLNVSMMHRLYQQERTKEGKTPLSIRIYRDIFNMEYNLGFHRPSKDLCDKCSSFRLASNDEKLSQKAEIDQHLSDHHQVRQLKEFHKNKSKEDGSFETYAFDLEEVLPTPKVNCSLWYYKRKLSTYNLSWYELGSSKATCNVWNESTAGRGSNEIASCMYTALNDAAERGVKNVALYSDSCGGQNKNRNFVCMMWMALNKFKLIAIEQVFFIRGHSKNENDSVHSAIERASSSVNVYTTGQWAAIMRTARHKNSYTVRELCVSDFLDFKNVAERMANFDLDIDKNSVKWLEIKRIKVINTHPNSFFISYKVKEDWIEVNMMRKIRKITNLDPHKIQLCPVNEGKISKINKDKKKDIMDLCHQKHVPTIHHKFFEEIQAIE